jgi:ribosomal protein S18 acetylase RimI-like enzyme
VTLEIRPAKLVDDSAGIAALDMSFATTAMYEVETGPREFHLVEKQIPRRVKRFAVYDLGRPDREWDEAHVATEDGRIVGFVASSYQFWNRRVVLWHIYVDLPWRGKGLGEKLLAKVFERATREKALSVFLETSNLNVPGVAWYEKRGFVLGGVDTTLYSGTEAASEKALFLVKFLKEPA